MRRLSIRAKLWLIVVVSTGCALLLAGALLAVSELLRLRGDLIDDLTALGGIVADNTTASLMFDDPQSAVEILRSLRSKEHVVLACLYDRDGARFAAYRRSGAAVGDLACPEAPGPMGAVIARGRAELFAPMTLVGEPVGTVYLRSSLEGIGDRLRLQLLTLFATMLLAGLAGLLLSLRLQRAISRPVAELASAAGAVGEGDYSVRARAGGDDELGRLVIAFNQMLAHIQSRDRELLQTQGALEQRVTERTRELASELAERKRAELQLAERNRQLAASNRELDDFAYVASHDLKEPLRGIHNYAGFLLEDYSDRLDEEGRNKLQTLMRLTRRMESLIESLLHYSRVGRVELATGDVDLQRVMEELVESLSITLAESGAEITIAGRLPVVRCDRVRVEEVFRNLVINAIKYNDSSEKRIEVGVVPPGGEAGSVAVSADHPAVLYVRDNGIGIPARHHQVIFDIFKRLHGREAYGGGTGSGLTIAKTVVERHGGRIWVDSRPGEGTTFYFTLQGEGEPRDA